VETPRARRNEMARSKAQKSHVNVAEPVQTRKPEDAQGLNVPGLSYEDIFSIGCEARIDIEKSVRAIAYLLEFLSSDGSEAINGSACMGFSVVLHRIASEIGSLHTGNAND
jgi:hypothetical protein